MREEMHGNPILVAGHAHRGLVSLRLGVTHTHSKSCFGARADERSSRHGDRKGSASLTPRPSPPVTMTQGSFEANPPFVEEVMERMVDHMHHLLERAIGPMSFAVIVPGWDDTESYRKMMRSVFTRPEPGGWAAVLGVDPGPGVYYTLPSPVPCSLCPVPRPLCPVPCVPTCLLRPAPGGYGCGAPSECRCNSPSHASWKPERFTRLISSTAPTRWW